jgi:hypothetical protein
VLVLVLVLGILWDENDVHRRAGKPRALELYLRVSVPLWLTYRSAKTPMTLFSNSLSFALIVSGRVR